MYKTIVCVALVAALLLSVLSLLKMRELSQLQIEEQQYWEELTYEHRLLQLQKMEEELNLEVNAICGN